MYIQGLRQVLASGRASERAGDELRIITIKNQLSRVELKSSRPLSRETATETLPDEILPILLARFFWRVRECVAVRACVYACLRFSLLSESHGGCNVVLYRHARSARRELLPMLTSRERASEQERTRESKRERKGGRGGKDRRRSVRRSERYGERRARRTDTYDSYDYNRKLFTHYSIVRLTRGR